MYVTCDLQLLQPCTKTNVHTYTIHKLHPLGTHFWAQITDQQATLNSTSQVRRSTPLATGLVTLKQTTFIHDTFYGNGASLEQ